MISKRVGELLKETRESKKLTIREVAQETNITPRFIEALEIEDYSIFPGETYTMGFLKGYAEFLNLDTEEVISLYRGLQIDQGKTPLKELTKPMRVIPKINKKFLFISAGVLAFAGFAYGSYWTFANTSLFDFGSSAEVEELSCSNRQTMNITIPPVGAIPKVENMSMENTFRFAVDTTTVKVCLEKVSQNPTGSRVAEFAVIVNDENAGSVNLEEGVTIILNDKISLLSSISRNINFTPRVLGDFSARVQLDSSERQAPQNAANPAVPQNAPQGTPPVQEPAGAVTTGDIQVSLKFINDSYLQWTTDGMSHTGLIMEGGKLRTLEAKNRLEIKIGNAGGVQILREGVPPKIAGPVGKFVRLTYRRVPDPLDPGIFKIQEAIEIVR
ncbi:MAG: DUF4115 domain-containing protein [Spirochaetia bacterium]|nr:DUF4115 domain-containing protein [Spirochaetia bacterium]